VQAAELSADLLGFPREDVERVRRVVEAIGCPVVAPDLGTQRWVELMGHDKKAQGGSLRFVVMPRIGEAECRDVAPRDLEPVLARTVAAGVGSCRHVAPRSLCLRPGTQPWPPPSRGAAARAQPISARP